jgi:hypothetical protein
MSRMMACRSSRESRSPAILRCSAAIDAAGSACCRLTAWPASSPRSAKASSLRPSSVGDTMHSSSTTLSTARMVEPLPLTSTFDSAWKPSARTAVQSRCR